MGIKCSLLGHAYAEADVERERTEQGDEVITVVREVERCTRCGVERVVSENTEVTAVVDPDEVDAEATAGDAEPVETEAEDPADGEAMSSIVDRADVSADDDSTPEEEAFEPPDDPAEEDAEILKGGGEQEREPGQWPEDEEPFDPDGLASESAEELEPDPEPAVEPVAEPTDENSGDASEDGDAPSEPQASLGGVGMEDADYVCPECGFAAAAATSSLREGDACPECGVGWLQVERNR